MKEIRLLFGSPIMATKEDFIASLRKLQAGSGCVIQAVDAKRVVSERHATFAAEKALQAFAEGRNVAKNLGVEVLRYVSGQRQIERALSMGVSDETSRVAIIVICDGEIPDLSGLVELDGKGCDFDEGAVRDAYAISDDEIGAVGADRIPDLVLERVALVDAYR